MVHRLFLSPASLVLPGVVLRKVWLLRLPLLDILNEPRNPEISLEWSLNLMTSAMKDKSKLFVCCQVATQEQPALRASGRAKLDSMKSMESAMHSLANFADAPVSREVWQN